MTVEEWQAYWFPPLKSAPEEVEAELISIHKEVDDLMLSWNTSYESAPAIQSELRIKECRT